MTDTRDEAAPVFDFALADRAYGMFTLDEKREALKIMARLRFPVVTDRFFEAVSRVIQKAEIEKARQQP